ncbi:hypothetical protein DFH11DRAFT_1851073 [Phellopilus nigrolimitatus]|nr:hypothetical protein DFH11DRAFT_1851073 [Phellopilus nigrolimitatus]
MRKGHGSSKVPGVKLRPAAPTKSSSSSNSNLNSSLKQPAWVQPSVADDVDASEILKSCKKPFVGVVVCASGVSDKVNIFQHAVHLGAQTSSDLTDRVTHLIAEAPGSAKYIYCVQHGIPVMQPSWINDSYAKWLSGESVGVESSVDAHRLPTFKSIHLCLTAFDDVQKRKQIRKLLEKNGGTYVDALDKGSRLTHLLCGPDRGEKADERGFTPKMQFIEKSNKRSAEKVHLVWEEWLWDCLEFKGLLKEKAYLANGPRPQRRVRREASPLMAPISSAAESLRRQDSIPPSLPSTTFVNPADVEEVVSVKRLPETTARLWEGLLKNRGFEIKDGKLLRSPTKTQSSNSASGSSSKKETRSPSPLSTRKPLPKVKPLRLEVDSGSSLSAAFKRTKSFAAKAAPSENPRSSSAFPSSLPSSSRLASTLSFAPVKEDNQTPDGERNLFAGLKFRALGDADGPKLAQAVELRGGLIFEGLNDDVDIIIVRLASGSIFYQNEQSEGQRKKYRTECWVEQCIFEERICASEEHLAFVPLRIPTPISGAEKLNLHISGLLASEKTPSVRLIKAIGGTVTDQLSRRNTHLLCPCGLGPKFAKAQEWHIPVVDLQWLYTTVKAGEVQGVSDYLVSPAAPPEEVSEGGITDITNSGFVQGSSKNKISEKGTGHSHSLVESLSPQTSCVEANTNTSWVTNGLLSEPVDQPPRTSLPPTSPPPTSPLSPREASTLSFSTRPSTPLKRRTASETVIIKDPSPPKKQADQLLKIPSSTTPSPLKMPVVRDVTDASASTLSEEKANVLKEAITTLLGKRQSSDDSVQVQSGRNGKRTKPPPRSKSKQEPFSRTTSSDSLARTGSVTSDYPLFGLDSKMPSIDAEDTDESMRVTYEDPSQQDEKRRLLELINNPPAEPEREEKVIPARRKPRNLVRRSSRVAGF